jgi:hypothetical protein
MRKDPRIWIINVHGPGGVGKSALVNWATYEFYGARQFEGIIHLTAKDSRASPSDTVGKFPNNRSDAAVRGHGWPS